jgi:N-formylglutamate amidohydrolase
MRRRRCFRQAVTTKDAAAAFAARLMMTALHQRTKLAGMDGELFCGVIDLRRPGSGRLPLILASPHSGSDYPAEFVAASRLDPLALRRSEDSFVDELFGAAPSLGAPLLAARFPRAYLDVNREAYELDPAMFSDALPEFVNAGSPRVRMGLGTIARIVANGEEIYSGKLCFAEARRRIESLYHPYHQVLSRLVRETEALFGGCLLVDCHSMPSAAGAVCGADGADIVLGDCHGAACAPAILEAARHFLAERGFAVGINAPYAGGFTTGHYGDPRRRRHALQIEINRALYMDERNFRRKPRFAQLAAEMSGLIGWLSLAVRECLADAAG